MPMNVRGIQPHRGPARLAGYEQADRFTANPPSAQSCLSAHGQPADVVAAGRRRCPRSPAHARGRPSRTAICSRINTAVPCNHGVRPRMVPAPGGTTTALMRPGRRATRSHSAGVHGPAALPRVCSRPATDIGNRPATTCRGRRLAGRSAWGSALRQRTL